MTKTWRVILASSLLLQSQGIVGASPLKLCDHTRCLRQSDHKLEQSLKSELKELSAAKRAKNRTLTDQLMVALKSRVAAFKLSPSETWKLSDNEELWYAWFESRKQMHEIRLVDILQASTNGGKNCLKYCFYYLPGDFQSEEDFMRLLEFITSVAKNEHEQIRRAAVIAIERIHPNTRRQRDSIVEVCSIYSIGDKSLYIREYAFSIAIKVAKSSYKN